MNHFFAPAVKAEKLTFDQLRVHRIESDNMEPSLCKGRDYVLVAPVNTYQGEGIYMIDVPFAQVLYRVSPVGKDLLRLWVDNPLYSHESLVSLDRFNDRVIGIVVADVKVREERFLHRQ